MLKLRYGFDNAGTFVVVDEVSHAAAHAYAGSARNNEARADEADAECVALSMIHPLLAMRDQMSGGLWEGHYDMLNRALNRRYGPGGGRVLVVEKV